MSDDLSRTAPDFEVPARYAAFDRLVALAETAVGDWPHRDALRLILVLEELFTNSIRHGYGTECERPVRLSLQRDGRAVLVSYEDEAPPFDPLARDLTVPAAANAGGLGLWLVRHYAQDCRYRRENDRNHISFRLLPDAPSAADG